MDSRRRAPGIEGFAHGRAELRFHNCLAPGKAWGDFTTQMEIEIGCLYHQKWGVKIGLSLIIIQHIYLNIFRM